MPERVEVTSVEAIASFRTRLVLYVSKARPALEEVSAEVLRTRLWLQNEQRVHLEAQVRRRERELAEAQQALFSVRLASLREETSAEQMAVQRAKRALEAAAGKLKLLKQWNRDFDNRVDPLTRQLDKLNSILTGDLTLAAAALARTVGTLDAYAGVAPAADNTSPPGAVSPGEPA